MLARCRAVEQFVAASAGAAGGTLDRVRKSQVAHLKQAWTAMQLDYQDAASLQVALQQPSSAFTEEQRLDLAQHVAFLSTRDVGDVAHANMTGKKRATLQTCEFFSKTVSYTHLTLPTKRIV